MHNARTKPSGTRRRLSNAIAITLNYDESWMGKVNMYPNKERFLFTSCHSKLRCKRDCRAIIRFHIMFPYFLHVQFLWPKIQIILNHKIISFNLA